MQKERKLRIDKILAQMHMEQAGACLISTMVNTYYLHGRIFKGYTYLSDNGEMSVFVKRPNDLRAEDLQITASQLHFIRKPEQIAGILQEQGFQLPEKLMVEGSEISYADWMRLQKCFPNAHLTDGTQAIRKARSIKTDYELNLLRLSAQMHVKAYRRIPEVFRPGMTELAFCIEIEHIMRQEGCLGLFRSYGNDMENYMGSLLAGENAAVSSPYDFALGGAGHPSNPIGAAKNVIREGQSVLIDMCGNFTGYLDDLTRCYSVGKLPEKAYKAHRTALEIQACIQAQLCEGTVCESLYEQALQIAAKNGLSDCFMGTRQQARFVGHGVGIVINELPVLASHMKETLQPGMVLAVEPKFVIEGVGAVGTENTFIVGKTSSEKLADLDDNIIDLLNYTK